MINAAGIAALIAKLNTAQVYGEAARLRNAAFSISTTGSNVHLAWMNGLNPRVYTAPEAEQLRQAALPVLTGTADFAGRLRKVAFALEQYADAVSPIKAKLRALHGEATALEAKVKAEGDDWTKNEDLTKENNRILGDVQAQVAVLSAAEQQCASAIYATYGGRPPAPRCTATPRPTTPPWGTAEKDGEESIPAPRDGEGTPSDAGTSPVVEGPAPQRATTGRCRRLLDNWRAHLLAGGVGEVPPESGTTIFRMEAGEPRSPH
ncbi:hypothetical protein ABZ801_00745 [Actinomadura sp. NPDC047616]|uniref:hypothetical protein n=1 Tax=Actinomadura sp. NPDC047616 TaxID=3155914 RepID=UPI0033C878D2